MHGGKSYGGHASPRLVHGWYSEYFPFTIMRAEARRQERMRRRLRKRLRDMGRDPNLADTVI
jgi:hypothetical protein